MTKMSDVHGYLIAVVRVRLRMTYEIRGKRKLHCGRICLRMASSLSLLIAFPQFLPYPCITALCAVQQPLTMQHMTTLWVFQFCASPLDLLCEFLAAERRCIVLPVRYELNLYMLCRRK
jgi:hypothetical protein